MDETAGSECDVETLDDTHDKFNDFLLEDEPMDTSNKNFDYSGYVFDSAHESRPEDMKYIEVLSRRISLLENQLRKANKLLLLGRKKFKNLEKYQINFEKRLQKYFGQDQLNMIRGKSKVHWLPETIAKAIYIRRKGRSVLENVRQFIAPLPSVTTCNRHISSLKFRPGIIDSNLEFLNRKCENLDKKSDKFILVFDETAIIPGNSKDPSTKHYFGSVTLPEDKKVLADQLLLFMVMGLIVRIKEMVAFHFTKRSCTKGPHLTDFIFKLICEIENRAKIRIVGISFDLSALNCSLLKELGIKFNLQNNTFFVDHPNRPIDKLMLIPDGTHCSKNLNQGLKNCDILISPQMRQEYYLDSNKAKLKDVEKIFKKDSNKIFKVMPKVTDEVIHTAHYAKMNPKNATKFHSIDVQTALEYSREGKKNFQKDLKSSTAFILSCLRRYHDLITSKNGWNKSDQKKFDEDVEFLEWFANYFLFNITVGNGNKKSMFGARMGIFSIIYLAKECFEDGSPNFIPSRALSDAIENKFSILRSLTPIPSAVQAIQSLRTMSVTPFQQKNVHGVYSTDENDPSTLQYMDMIKEMANQQSHTDDNEKIHLSIWLTIPSEISWQELLSDEKEFNAYVCHLSELLNRILKKIKCEECHLWLLAKHSMDRLEGFKLLAKRRGTGCYSKVPSIESLKLFLKLECLYQKLSNHFDLTDEEFETSYVENVHGENFYDDIHCFPSLDVIARLYFEFRLKIQLHCRFVQNAQKLASSSLKLK